MKTGYKVFTGVFLFCMAISSPVWANKSKVEIDAPVTAKKGSEVTVKIHVKHDSNSFLHYTNGVYLKVNGKQMKRWEYSNFSRPEGSDFTVSHTIKVQKELELEVRAHCNSHGSAGPDTHTIKVK